MQLTSPIVLNWRSHSTAVVDCIVRCSCTGAISSTISDDPGGISSYMLYLEEGCLNPPVARVAAWLFGVGIMECWGDVELLVAF